MKNCVKYSKLKEVCLDFIVPQRDKPKSFDGNIPWCRIEDIEGKYLNGSKSNQNVSKELADSMNMHICPQGTVICACSASIGNQAITTIDCYTNQTFIGVVVNPTLLFNEYLYYFFSSQKENLQKMGRGATIKYISRAKFENLIIPIPPLAEQERIVAELDLLSSIIEKKKAQLKELDQLAQSIFYDMFGDPITNEKGWEVKKLKEVCENCDSMRKPITAKDRIQGLIPYYGASGVVDYVKDYIFDGEYLLISEDGANLLARSTPIAFSIKGKTWVNNHAHVLKFANKIVQQYVEFSINLRDISSIVTGCAQPKLTQANLNKIAIAYPPLPLQQEFASKIEAIERQKSLIQQSIVETQTLFDSRMDYWFG